VYFAATFAARLTRLGEEVLGGWLLQFVQEPPLRVGSNEIGGERTEERPSYPVYSFCIRKRYFEQDDLSTMLAFDVEEVLIQHGKGFLKS